MYNRMFLQKTLNITIVIINAAFTLHASIPNVIQKLDFRPSQSLGVGQSQLARISNTDDVVIAPTARAFTAVQNQFLSHVGYTDNTAPLVTKTSVIDESIGEQIPLCISLGATCTPAAQLRNLGWRHEAYPFDWITSPFEALYQAIDDDFFYFLTDLQPSYNNIGLIDHYGFYFTHDWPKTKDESAENDCVGGNYLLPNWQEDTAIVKNKYLRRIERFKNACLGKQKVLFIRTEYITKQEAILLKELIESKWPELDFVLFVMAAHLEFQNDWGIERIKNFQGNLNSDDLPSIRNLLMHAIHR